MLTDLASSHEEAVITFTPSGGTPINIGTCDGGNTCDACCTWFDCQLQLEASQITMPGTATSMEVKLEYTSTVSSSSWAKCTDPTSGKSGAGVARVILTPLGKTKTTIYFHLHSR